jgi:ribosomal protein S18 acetylase RimI-like enzyme
MMSTPRSQFVVRELHSDEELAECLAIDRSYLTDHVWQMDVRDDRGEIAVRFRSVRLPRMMAVEYPREAATLLRLWRQRDCFLVALAEGLILGYVNVRIKAGEQGAWIEDLVVNTPFRRHKIGSALLEQAGEQALAGGLHHLTLAVQTKNHPAITFAQANGLVFCGYNDHYYPNQDIAVFFTRNLR